MFIFDVVHHPEDGSLKSHATFLQVRAGCAAVLTDETKGRYYILEADGQPAAQLMITYEWSDWRNSNMWWIQSVYVITSHRRRGLFTELFGAVREAATAEGVEVMRLYADNGNARAHAAYIKLGMSSHYACFEIELKKST